MKYYSSFITGLLLILFLLQPTFVEAQYSFDKQKLDNYLTSLEEYDKFMGSVAILEDDKVLFEKAYGFTDENENPADTQTVYRVGSITKSFTASIVMKLVEDGEIQLSDKLSEFYPDLPNADTITIEQLLYHRAGLVSFTSMTEYQDYFEEESDKEEMLERFIQYGTAFEPGEKFEYSNTGYVLLGYIIEEVTEMNYGEALEAYITEPLGLGRTYYGSDISIDNGEAYSFNYNAEQWEISTETHMSVPHGAGAIVSTPTEIATFYDALFDGEIVSKESVEKMKSLKDGYGLGIFRFPFYDRFAWGHNGGIDAFQSTAGHFPESDLTFTILGNGVNYSLNDISIGLLSILFGREFEIPDFENEPRQVELSRREMRAYTGHFSAESLPIEIEVFIEKGILKAQATGQGAIPLTPFEDGVMKFVPAGVTMVFSNLQKGQYQEFELQQGGQSFTYVLSKE